MSIYSLSTRWFVRLSWAIHTSRRPGRTIVSASPPYCVQSISTVKVTQRSFGNSLKGIRAAIVEALNSEVTGTITLALAALALQRSVLSVNQRRSELALM